jgi:transposase
MMDLQTATREELIQLIIVQNDVIAQLRAQIVVFEERLAAPEGRVASHEGKPAEKAPPKWVKTNRPKGEKRPRKKRSRGYGRRRSQATRQVRHAVETCSNCGQKLMGGSVKRRREVLHIALQPLEVIEHVFVERRCPVCNTRETPSADVLRGEVLGRHRVSLQTMAMIATMREEGRLPIGEIQWMLQAFYGLELSQGELVSILQAVADHGRGQVAELRKQLRKSPVVHGDETSWRENGQNGWFWSFSTSQISYFEHRLSRSGQIVEDVMGRSPNTTMTCDFYGAYNRHHGPHQRCWAHLLRDVHDLKAHYPEDEEVQAWVMAVHALYVEACQFRDRHREEEEWGERYKAACRFKSELLALCEPFLEKETPQRVLCQRCHKFIGQLFRFVVDLRVPSTNNAAERAIRPIAVSRKISGGTRSARGSETKSILASLFGTWRLQGLNPFMACSRLLASPQI